MEVSLFRVKLEEGGIRSARTATEPVPISKLELVPVCGEHKHWISGRDLLMRAKKVGACLGLDQVEYMLKRRDEFPEEWRRYFLHFTEVLMYSQENRSLWAWNPPPTTSSSTTGMASGTSVPVHWILVIQQVVDWSGLVADSSTFGRSPFRYHVVGRASLLLPAP